MKVTFELPPPLVHRLRSSIPSGERSRFVADLISKKLRGKGTALEEAARKANALRKPKPDIKQWETLNEYDAIVDQIRAVDKKRFVNRAGILANVDLRNLEMAAKQVLQLP